MIRKSSVYHMLQIGLVLSQFLPGTLLTVEAAQLVYENTFTNNWGDTRKKSTPRKPSSCENSAFSRVSDPVGGADQVAKFFQAGDGSCLASDDKHRTQVLLEGKDGKLLSLANHTHYYVGYRLYIPPNFPSQWLDNNNAKIAHFYTNRSQGQSMTPAFILEGKGSTAILRAERRYIDNSGNNNSVNKIPLNSGWNTIVYHVKYEWNNTGVWELWVNGVQTISKNGVQTATDPAIVPGGATVSAGVYWGLGNRPSDALIYIDDIRIASGSDGFGLVNPNSSSLAATPHVVKKLIRTEISTP